MCITFIAITRNTRCSSAVRKMLLAGWSWLLAFGLTWVNCTRVVVVREIVGVKQNENKKHRVYFIFIALQRNPLHIKLFCTTSIWISVASLSKEAIWGVVSCPFFEMERSLTSKKCVSFFFSIMNVSLIINLFMQGARPQRFSNFRIISSETLQVGIFVFSIFQIKKQNQN